MTPTLCSVPEQLRFLTRGIPRHGAGGQPTQHRRERLKHGSTHLDAEPIEDRVARAEQPWMSMPVMPIMAARPLLRSALSFVLPRKSWSSAT